MSAPLARDILKSLVSRIENIEGEIADLNNDKRDVYAEARSQGFDVKALKAVIARRRKDVGEVEEHEAIVETYLAALASGTESATRARARDATDKPAGAIEPSPAVMRTADENRAQARAIPYDLSIPDFLVRSA